MTDEELGKRIAASQEPLEITFRYAPGDTGFSSALFGAARSLCDAGGERVVCRECEAPDHPAVTFRRDGCGSVTWMALPDGPEREPFEEMLLSRRDDVDAKSGGLRESIGPIERPVSIEVFIAAACPHCPNAVRAANRLALASPHVKTTVIDTQQFPELAAKFNIRTVPMTIIDGELLFNEVVAPEVLAEAVGSKSRGGYLARALRSHVDTGTIDTGVRLLRTAAGAPDAFVDVWRESVLSIRMGLMLMAGQALEERPELFDAVVPRLIPLLDTVDQSLRGDTADLLGQIAHPGARQALEQLLGDADPDIVEIAEEALENLRNREE